MKKSDRIAHIALQRVAAKHVEGSIDNRSEIEKVTSQQNLNTLNIDAVEQENPQTPEVQIEAEATSLHSKLMALVKAYQVAAKAQVYPQNTFKIGRGNYFVSNQNNYYLYLTSEVAKIKYDYYISETNWLTKIFNDQNNTIKNLIAKTQGNVSNGENALIGMCSGLTKTPETDPKYLLKKQRIKDKEELIKEQKRTLVQLEGDSILTELSNLNQASFDMNLSTKEVVQRLF